MTAEELVSLYKKSTGMTCTHELLKRSMAESPSEGLVLEFGVATGGTISTLARATERTVYGFDSFEGLPEHWNETNPKGSFDMGGELPSGMPDNVELVTGWFNETLPGFLGRVPGNVAFLHIDCDLYSSTKTVLDALTSRIKDGTVIVFNEFWDYPEASDHEAKAFSEFLTLTGFRAEALHRCGSTYCSASFRIRG